ncbi:helix-turn-helix domain-containing protein [Sphingobacterium sp. FBM7-1]|uniref:helix-turn-helix domain-containing protein n=1 Tax=Sphingobacterium sp. FBM7-1 TaxID=2886688 RepID=UPI001D116A62|nr:helix-turn-helix domain-containing protein [Sphingobacterium sp. FBM7-1]
MFTLARQLERNFKRFSGMSPKKYSNIIRFQNALSLIKKSDQKRSLLAIVFECGYYNHSHLANEIKRNTGLPSSLL